jgi:hypothetical protein
MLAPGDPFPTLTITPPDTDPLVAVRAHELTFPVGHSADADVLATATGAFVNPEPRYVQSTGFVLDPPARRSSACTRAARSAGSSPTT